MGGVIIPDESRKSLVDHSDFDSVGPGLTLYLNRHESVRPFYFFIFATALSLALRARGFKTISSVWAVIGFLLSKRICAS